MAENNRPERLAPGLAKRGPGRPFPPGTSGNPGGRPAAVAELLRQFRELAAPHLPELFAGLLEIATARTDEGGHAYDAKDRIAATREIYDRAGINPPKVLEVKDGDRQEHVPDLRRLSPAALAELERVMEEPVTVEVEAHPADEAKVVNPKPGEPSK